MWTADEQTAVAVRELDTGRGVTQQQVASHFGMKKEATKRRMAAAHRMGLIESIGFISPKGGRLMLWRATAKVAASGLVPGGE